MELTYRNEKLKNICENPKYNRELIKKYGDEVAKNLPKRINQLKAFETLNDVPINPPFRRHKLTGNRKNEFSVDITRQYRLVFTQKDNNIIIEDLREIKSIEILEVSKHYE